MNRSPIWPALLATALTATGCGVLTMREADHVKNPFSPEQAKTQAIDAAREVVSILGIVCFITDAFSRMIVGWRVASNMRTTMVGLTPDGGHLTGGTAGPAGSRRTRSGDRRRSREPGP